MTVPAGAKIIANKYRHRCYACKAWVEPEAGAAILDVNITGKWETFHTVGCLPQPYEAGDIHVYVSHPYHRRGPVTPGHERCTTCSHWQMDHSTGVCVGSFKGAGGQCNCTGYVSPVNPVLHPSQVQPMVQAMAAAAANPAVPPTGIVPPTYGVNGIAAVAQATQPGMRAGWRGAIPMNDTDFRLVVFFGPIHSASDGQSHFVSANTVLELHRMPMAARADCPVEFVGPDDKRVYRPRQGDFIIGPRYTPSEYEEAAQALADRLAQEGITS